MITQVKMWITVLLCTSMVTAVPLSSFYPYGSAAGDSALGSMDDAISPAISASVAFGFYQTLYSTLFVNNNGMITLGGEFYSYFPNMGAKFPIDSSLIATTIVAPFMADVDNTVGNGNVWYRLTSNVTLLSKAKNEIPVALSGQNYNPRLLFISTWDHAGYYSQHIDKTNTFQCILVTNSSHTYCIFKYADGMIQWTSGDVQASIGMLEAQVGFNAGDGVKYAIVPGSLTTSIINISRTSNVGVPGQWIALISGADVTLAGVNMCAPNASKGPCEHICTDLGAGSFNCSCYTGYVLSGYSCYDINECSSNGGHGPCQQNCTNTNGSFYCSCTTGYNATGYSCNDINECSSNEGHGPCQQNCTNTNGSFYCSCVTGYELSGYNCIDVDECMTNGSCPQVCTNTIGSYYCSRYSYLNELCINGSCRCTELYTGSNCSQPVFSGCQVNPCLNGGTCLPGQNSTCICPGNTTGRYCETTLQSCTLGETASSVLTELIKRRRYLGAVESVPGKDCAEIKSIRTEVSDGVYWTLGVNQTAQAVFCQYSEQVEVNNQGET